MEGHSSSSSSIIVSKDLPESSASLVLGFFNHMGVSKSVVDPPIPDSKDFYSVLIQALLKVDSIQRGKIVSTFSVKPVVTNYFGGLHGGAVASVAERVAIACARTVVAEDKELFLGEMSISYLSSAPKNSEVRVEGSVVRTGRNLTVVAIEFKSITTRKLLYTARSTFYHLPASRSLDHKCVFSGSVTIFPLVLELVLCLHDHQPFHLGFYPSNSLNNEHGLYVRVVHLRPSSSDCLCLHLIHYLCRL